jgi:hydrogenase expression/formation protein HypE
MARKMKDKLITLAHGAGGQTARNLIRDTVLKYFTSPVLRRLEDSARIRAATRDLAFTTDSYVVDPVFFPGGDIGRLAVCGTVNDLAMKGAVPKYISFALIIEEGFSLADLEKILRSASRAAREAAVAVVCGDTKVVPKGKADKIFITTSGVGEIRIRTGQEFIRPGDRIVLSGTVADHGIAVLNARLKLGLRSGIRSDTRPLNRLAGRLHKFGPAVRFLRDPTRGGVASVLNEAVADNGLGMVIDETKVPVRAQVRGACRLLGLDPLYIANEGKFIAVVDPRCAEEMVRALRADPLGRNAGVIGEVKKKIKGVWLRTSIGSQRPLLPLEVEALPRIC